MKFEEADELFRKSIDGAFEHLEKMKALPKDSLDYSIQQMRCIQALQMFTDNDEAIDALYDKDMSEQ